MEKKLVLRGMLAGLVGGVFAFVFARIFAEPQIQKAINYEGAREAAQEALEHHSGGGHDHGEVELFSRAVQSNVGLGFGIIAVGVAFGALYGIVYTICLGRVGNLRARTLALLVAGGGFLSLYLVPFLKYPANPPAIGNADTIRQRGAAYLFMVLVAVAALYGAVTLGKRLKESLGSWNATLVAAASYVAVIAVAMLLLPSTGDFAHAGTQTDTPTALLDDEGAMVFPGFPADVLASFRLYAIGAQVMLWGAIGLVFAPLADRLLSTTSSRTPEQLQVV